MSTVYGNPNGETNVAKGIDWITHSEPPGLRVANSVVRKAGAELLLHQIRDECPETNLVYHDDHCEPSWEKYHWYFTENDTWSIAVVLLPEYFGEEEQAMASILVEEYWPEIHKLIRNGENRE